MCMGEGQVQAGLLRRGQVVASARISRMEGVLPSIHFHDGRVSLLDLRCAAALYFCKIV